MNLGDLAPGASYALTFMVGMVPGWVAGRADFGLRLRYWRDIANRNRRPLPPYTPTTAGTAAPEPTPTTTIDNQTEAA